MFYLLFSICNLYVDVFTGHVTCILYAFKTLRYIQKSNLLQLAMANTQNVNEIGWAM